MSNKTPKNLPNETKSAPNTPSPENISKKSKFRLAVGIALIIFGLLTVGNAIYSLAFYQGRTRMFFPNNERFLVEVVETPELRTLGLSGRDSIGSETGMLFVFDDSRSSNCFWMKDMQFAIDMVWLDVDKKVVTVEEFVEPSTFPDSFCPESPAKYGLELQAYRAEELDIVPGASLRF